MNNNYYTIEPQQYFQPSYNSFQPEALTSKNIQRDANINTNWNYRKYMQKNANEIMKYNSMKYIYTSGNNPYTVLNTNPVNKMPFLYTSIHDTNNPPYGFRNSDLKYDFMKKQQMQAKMVSPSIPTNFLGI